MLAYDALIENAKSRGMPTGKIRGILREYLQILILKEIYRLAQGKKFYFTGGTYLRLLHQTRRFSEDLDFNVSGMTSRQFEDLLKKVKEALGKDGMDVKLDFEHWGNLFVAELIFPTIEKIYAVVSPNSKKGGIMIKVEANQPRWNIKPETLVVSGFGQMYPVICTQKGALFADKIDALLKKNRARHLFDIIFMLSKKYPVDLSVLRFLGIKTSPLETILKQVNTFSAQELKRQAESLRPFLFDEKEADLILSAPLVVQQFVDSYS
jgi:predicted nucleotidyltransferase component of viral defense system